jgi:dTMP kinase
MFITFEGLDFCGKSTQVKLLKKYFEEKNKEVKLIREPGGVKISEKIRELLLDTENSEMTIETEALLFAASRSQLVREKIIPFLEQGYVVISDRFHDSSIAYQGYGRGINTQFVIDLQKFAIGSAIPTITFFIDIPIEEVLKRKQKLTQKELDRIEVSKSDFYEKVRNGYKTLAKEEERFVTLNGLMQIEEIHKIIVDKIKGLLKEE